MRKSGVEEWLAQAVMALYSGVRTMVGHEEVRCGGVAGTSVMALYSEVRTMVGHEEVRCGGVAGTSSDGIV